MEFWKLVQQPVRHKNLVVKLMRDIESGNFIAPKAYDVLIRYPTEQLSLGMTQLPKVDLPEKPLIKAFLQKYPEAKYEPVALDSFRPPLARRFVQRQVQLMQAGSDTASAFTQAEKELAEPLKALSRPQLSSASGSNPVELLLAQEQEQLDAGLGALAAQRAGAAAAGGSS
ncbi:hypothetical protein Agub_g5144 [Astrephomene gubernaculifera]|uniref:Uncharacterized protein n=1 Tax=Astrephomene gubernaculifera TaxID=47775 RepID=A0AAD3HKH1_9CHLO|nr:hypothetical protein Agub_g5144 [Astrephomene gubernaculifera]